MRGSLYGRTGSDGVASEGLDVLSSLCAVVWECKLSTCQIFLASDSARKVAKGTYIYKTIYISILFTCWFYQNVKFNTHL